VKFSESPLLSQLLPAWRARVVLVLLLGGFVAVLSRAVWLQVVDSDFLAHQGDRRSARVVAIPAYRGRILDRHGDVLAVSSPVKSIVADASAAELTPGQVRQLARALDMDVRDINRKLSRDATYVALKRKVPPGVAKDILALKLPGIRADGEYQRFYPAGEMTAHVLGFTGADDRGQEGMELAFEERLAGRPGKRAVTLDSHRRVVEDKGTLEAPQQGEDILLSLDAKIQYLAYSALKQAVLDNKARAGGIVVIDSKSGEILALANYPAYNPNNRSRIAFEQLRNRAFTDAFEPGSTLKPFSVSMVLEHGLVRADTKIDTSPGCLAVKGARICDAHRHEILTVAEVIQKSSNVGTVKMTLELPREDMWQSFHALGFGTPMKLGFPGETAGVLRPARQWREVNQATMSYGHGISVSLMQLARAYTVFARDGELIPLSLVKSDGAGMSGTRVFSPHVAQQMRDMLEMAVQDGGTAPRARIRGYRVAGKTGTAHKLEGGRYVRKYVSAFAGFAPVSEPRLVLAVMIDEPDAGKHYGGDVAAPVFSQVMEGALRTLGVAPDAPLEPLRMAVGGAPSAVDVPPQEQM